MKTSLNHGEGASWIVKFYGIWHGQLHLPGAGRLLQTLAGSLPELQNYPLVISPRNTIRVDFRDVAAFAWANFLLGEGLQEDSLISAMARRPKAGRVFWDVGANAGLVSYSMAQKARPSQIEFFEPQPFLFQSTHDALAGIVAARGHPMALSDHCGTERFLLMRGESTKSRLGGSAAAENHQQVEVNTGDSLILSGKALPPDLIKIDTEGHEREVLRGLQETIRRYRPDIFFEHISFVDDEIKAMIPPGYRPFAVCDQGGNLVEGIHRNLGTNSAFLIEA